MEGSLPLCPFNNSGEKRKQAPRQAGKPGQRIENGAGRDRPPQGEARAGDSRQAWWRVVVVGDGWEVVFLSAYQRDGKWVSTELGTAKAYLSVAEGRLHLVCPASSFLLS